MSRFGGGGLLQIFCLSVAALAPSGCSQNPNADTQCVYENGEVATGSCLTECESQCNLEAQAGCAKSTCLEDCDEAASKRSSGCEDARYALWRCLRVAGLPEVDCSGPSPMFVAPDTACRAEASAANGACTSPDAGSDASAR